MQEVVLKTENDKWFFEFRTLLKNNRITTFYYSSIFDSKEDALKWGQSLSEAIRRECSVKSKTVCKLLSKEEQ